MDSTSNRQSSDAPTPLALSGPSVRGAAGGALPAVPVDLSPESVNWFWRSRNALNAIQVMELAEPWTVDGRREGDIDIEEIVRDLSERLSLTPREVLSLSLSSDAVARDAVGLMGHLHAGRALVLFHWLTEVSPSVAESLLRQARLPSGETEGSSDFSLLLIDRITALERQLLLSRVFSPERTALVLEILSEAGYVSDDL
jgi:hypothetical protein